MDLTLNRTALLDELQLIQGVVDRRTTIPILTNILLTATGDRLHLAGTDLDVTVFTQCSAAVRHEGQTTINGKMFVDLVRSLPTETLDLSYHENRVEVRSGTFSSQLASLDPADFPTLPEVPEGHGFALSLSLLHRMIDYTSFAISAEEGHFQYNAALLLPGEDSLQMVTTDGHRLSWVKAPSASAVTSFEQQLLPRKLLLQLRRLVVEEGTPLYVARGENHLAFRFGDRVLLSRVLEARFPQYERVLVRDNPLHATVQRQEFQASLRRVALLASARTHGVQLQFDEDTLSLASVGFDLGQAAEVIPCRYHGQPTRVLVNATYVLDFLAAVECPSVEIDLRDGDGPVVLRPSQPDEPISDCLYVIMPIRA